MQRDTSPSRSEILSKSSSTCNLILISRFHKRELYQEYVDLLKPGKINIHHLRRRLLLLLTFVFDTCVHVVHRVIEIFLNVPLNVHLFDTYIKISLCFLNIVYFFG